MMLVKAHVFSSDQGVYGMVGYTAEHDVRTIFHVIFSEQLPVLTIQGRGLVITNSLKSW